MLVVFVMALMLNVVGSVDSLINGSLSIIEVIDQCFNNRFDATSWGKLPQENTWFDVDRRRYFYNANYIYSDSISASIYQSKIQDIFALGNDSGVDAIHFIVEQDESILKFLNRDLGKYSSAMGMDFSSSDDDSLTYFGWRYKDLLITLAKHQITNNGRVIQAQAYFDISITRRGISELRTFKKF